MGGAEELAAGGGPKIEPMSATDVAIAGGGIIGLATAMELAAAGFGVTVFDKAEAMSEASRAAVGMLAGNDPENPPELRELARLSLRLYPEFLARVEELSGVKIPIRTTVTVQGMKHLPEGLTALNDAQVEDLAPGIAVNGWRFALLEEKSFDAWDLAEALPAAALRAGVAMREHCAVRQVRSGSGGVTVETAAGMFPAAVFVNCAGAWSAALNAVPVSPRKGHLLTAVLPGTRQMRCVLRTAEVYIVPRGDHRYTVGPTVESAGFDKNVDQERIQELFHRAAQLWPPLREARVAETWTGLRPGSEDGLPIVDRLDANRWVATGHYKNGILLGPGTGRAMSQWICRETPEVELSAFRSGRFAAAPAR